MVVSPTASELTLTSGVRAFLADDHRIPMGQGVRSSMPVISAIRVGPDFGCKRSS